MPCLKLYGSLHTARSSNELLSFTVLIKTRSFIGDSATPKGCAGIEPATTQRVSPRLLPSAFVYTTEFHPMGKDGLEPSKGNPPDLQSGLIATRELSRISVRTGLEPVSLRRT